MKEKMTDSFQMTVNHLEVEPERGKTMDIVMKKIKHKVRSSRDSPNSVVEDG